jgi:hypothetical protein
VNTVFSVLQSPIHTPYQEYLVKWNEVHQHFLSNPMKPEGGIMRLPDFPGLSPTLAEDKIETSEEL